MQMEDSLIKKDQVNHRNLKEVVPKLYKYCYFLTKNKWDGEDIAQETIYKALTNYRDHDVWSSALLHKMAYHLWIDQIRKREKDALFSEIDIEDKTNTANELCSELIESLSHQLTPKQLVTFVLKESFQYKISEIAVLLDMSETGVKALLNRTRTRMKKLSNTGIESYWTDEMYDTLYPVLMHSLNTQDPATLIQLLPIISLSISISSKTPSVSPSNVLSMAA